MRLLMLPSIIGAVLLTAQFPLRAEPSEGDPASGEHSSAYIGLADNPYV